MVDPDASDDESEVSVSVADSGVIADKRPKEKYYDQRDEVAQDKSMEGGASQAVILLKEDSKLDEESGNHSP